MAKKRKRTLSKKELRTLEQRVRAKRRRAGPGPIELRMRTQFRSRKTGKIVAYKKRKGAIQEKIQEQIDAKGRVLRTTGYTTKEEVMRTVVAGLIEEEGKNQGMVGVALDKTNIMSPSSLRGARKIVGTVKGVDPKGNTHRFKFDIDAYTVNRHRRHLRSVLLGTILHEMRKRSWRTWYRISYVDWTKKHHVSRSKVQSMVPMQDVEIVIRVLR